MRINYEKIGFRIGQRRRELKLKQAELAEQIEVSAKYISNLETGKRHPSLELIVSLCDALKTTPDYFILGSMKKDIESNIIDELKLCSPEDKAIIENIIQVYVEKNN